jgi:DHA2 family multidrug resistance protein
VGISIVIANLTSGTRMAHAVLVEHITPFNNALQMPNVAGAINMATDTGRAMMDAIVTLQATIIAFGLDYQLIMLVTLAAIPMALIIGSSKAQLRAQAAKPGGDEHPAVME